MQEEKVGENTSRYSLRHNIIRDINYLKSKGMISDNDVYYLIKNFLKDFLNLNYEFTKDELFNELKNIYLPYNIRADFFKFIEQVFMFEYSDIKYSEDELRIFLDQFKHYIDYLLISPQERKKKVAQIVMKSWKDKLALKFHSIFNKTHKNISVNENKTDVSLMIVDPDNNFVKLNNMVEKIYSSLYNSDILSATEIYKQVVELYDKLSADEKASYYETLSSVYNSIKNAY